MKRLVIFAVMSVMSMSVFATQASPEALAGMKRKIDVLVAEGKPTVAALWQGRMDACSIPTPATFEELRKIVEDGVRKHVKDEAEVTKLANSFLMSACCWGMDRKFIKEGFAIAKSSPNPTYVYYYADAYKTLLGVSDAELYGYSMEALRTGAMRPDKVRYALSRIPKLKPEGISDAVTLKELRYINQVYTAKMVKDEETWKAIVVIIRTLMDSYK